MHSKKKNDYITGTGERLSFGLYAFGTILSYYMVLSYLQIYMTDVGIPAVAVGMIFIAAKVWDAVNDPIFGVIVDKVHLKGGKYKPWLRIATMAIPITTILMFIIPSGASAQVKIIWSSVAYVLWDTAYTMCDVPMNALVTAMTENQTERNQLYSLSAFFVYLGGLLVAIFVPTLYPSIGWNLTAVILGILCFAGMIPLNLKCKERYAGTSEEEASVTDILLSLVRNKYLLIYTLAAIIGSITDFANTLNGYVAIHCLGGESYITLLSLATAVPVMFVVLFVPRLLKKFDKFNLFVITRVATILVSIVIFLVGYGNLSLLLGLIVLKSLFSGVWGVTAVMFIADCVEYGQFRNGERNQGIAFATKAFTNKIIVAITGALGMFGLAAFGFVEGANVAQSAATVQGIWLLYAIGPIVGSILCVIIMLAAYKLRDQDVAVMIRCNNGELTKEEAEKMLSRKI